MPMKLKASIPDPSKRMPLYPFPSHHLVIKMGDMLWRKEKDGYHAYAFPKSTAVGVPRKRTGHPPYVPFPKKKVLRPLFG